MKKLRGVKQLIFDADDTLWENNIYFIRATENYLQLFDSQPEIKKRVAKRFNEIEKQVVTDLGCGSDSYNILLRKLHDEFQDKLTDRTGKNSVEEILEKFNLHREMPPPLFRGVSETLDEFAKRYELYALTKGKQDEQSDKFLRSGLRGFFREIHIVPEKNDKVYKKLIEEHAWVPKETCMIGNSPKSDINPALRCGMWAILIPYRHTWRLDLEEPMSGHPGYRTVASFPELLNLL